MSDNVIQVDGLDLLDIIGLVDKKKNKFAALTLQEIEGLPGIDEETFKLVRKFILDGFGDFTRSTLRLLLGDVEMAPYKGYDKSYKNYGK